MNEDKMQVEEQLNQAPNQTADMTPDEAMANLAFATNLQEQMLQMQGGGQTTPEEGEIGVEIAPEGTETPETGNIPPTEETPATEPEIEEKEVEEEEEKVDLDTKFEEVKSELKDTIKEEMKGFKKMIKDAIAD